MNSFQNVDFSAIQWWHQEIIHGVRQRYMLLPLQFDPVTLRSLH